MVQEFGGRGNWIYDNERDLKKRQSEFWWRKNGWEGVRVGVFEIRKGEECEEEMT